MAEPAGDAAYSRDRLLDGRVVLRQPAAGYRAAIDPVLLAAAVPAHGGERVLDIGTGTGAALICLAARVAACRVTGLEVQETLADCAAENVVSNGFEGRCEILAGDLLQPPSTLRAAAFDHVMANPPYGHDGQGKIPPEPSRAVAHFEGQAGLADWLDFGLAMLRPKGSLTVIHRADRIEDVLTALRGRTGEIVIFPLWPKAEVPAKRMLVRARKEMRTPTRIAPGLVLHREDGRYTEAAEAVLRGGAKLAL